MVISHYISTNPSSGTRLPPWQPISSSPFLISWFRSPFRSRLLAPRHLAPDPVVIRMRIMVREPFWCFWMVNWAGMTAWGLACETLDILLGQRWTTILPYILGHFLQHRSLPRILEMGICMAFVSWETRLQSYSFSYPSHSSFHKDSKVINTKWHI